VAVSLGSGEATAFLPVRLTSKTYRAKLTNRNFPTMATNNGNNNGNNNNEKKEPTLEELLRMAMEEATAEPSKATRKARPNGAAIAPSTWFQGLSTADQKVLTAAGWQETPASFTPVAGSVTAARPEAQQGG
jgi:hypothetical protein